jgi:hypothetical protein
MQVKDDADTFSTFKNERNIEYRVQPGDELHGVFSERNAHDCALESGHILPTICTVNSMGTTIIMSDCVRRNGRSATTDIQRIQKEFAAIEKKIFR